MVNTAKEEVFFDDDGIGSRWGSRVARVWPSTSCVLVIGVNSHPITSSLSATDDAIIAEEEMISSAESTLLEPSLRPGAWMMVDMSIEAACSSPHSNVIASTFNHIIISCKDAIKMGKREIK